MNTQAILFDLDGTLCDTALDLTVALNHLLREEGRAPLFLSQVRTQVSHGSSAMIRLGFPDCSDQQLATLKHRFFALYAEHIAVHTQLFPRMRELLIALKNNAIPWGIVTNKPTQLTEQLLPALQLPNKPTCVICGDTLSVTKPDPAPLWLAAEKCQTPVSDCIYIGDHPRDIEAAQRAGMKSIAVTYGYLSATDQPQLWGADDMVDSPHHLAYILGIVL